MPWQAHVTVPPTELAQVTCARLAAAIGDSIDERGGCHLAVSGGHTPTAAFDLLATMPLPWPAVHVWQVDERVAPDRDPERNANALVDHLVGPIRLPAANVHLMPVVADDLELAAAAYAAELADRCGGVLDVIHLGLGADGHTASWVPDDPVGDVEDRDVAVTFGEYQGTRRMTLTVPCVNRGRVRILAVGGEDKAHAMTRYLSADRGIPASRLSPMTTVLDATGAF